MSSHYRFYPLPRPSLKSERSSRSSYCACNPPCNGETCNSYRSSANNNCEAPYPPHPPSPHVHFSGLCQTYLVDYEYDRSPTVVMPNDCALPARGCPGKTYFANTVANVARQGRRLSRCATPGASRANSRSRNNMSPPPSPSLYTKHIFYPDEYPFPSPIPSPRVNPPALVPDSFMNPQSSDDSDAGLCTPPEAASQAPSPPSLSRRGTNQASHSHSGSQIFINAPGHPPIPGLMSPSSPRGGMADMFAITNALNGLEMTTGAGPNATNGLMLDSAWSIPNSNNASPKKVKTKKSKSSLSGVAEATRRARLAATASWTSDQGVLGGF